jgi:outer membrane protein assembly factor BamB
MMSRPALLLLLLLPLTAAADNWPGWRGPTADGVSAEKNLPVTWSATENVRWKVPVPGAGVSSPVVWGERVFLTASTGRRNDELHVLCYHRKDGKLLWHSKLFGSAPTDLYPPGGMAVPTPVADGKHLYCLFGTGDLFCLDFDGRPVWVRSLAEEYGPFRNRWGMGTSPILVDGLLVVQVDHTSRSYLLGVDAATGANRWKVDREAGVNWTSPLAVRLKDHVEIVAIGTYRAHGYDAKNGGELWSVTGMHEQCIPSPVALGDRVFLSSGVGTLAVKLDGTTGEVDKSNVVWRNKKIISYIASPVAYEGRLYIVDGKGFCTCLDGATGKQVWRDRMGDQNHSSPVIGDGKIYVPSKDGVVRVARAGPVFELLAVNDIGEQIVASLAVSDGDLFIRGEKHLFCIRGNNK